LTCALMNGTREEKDRKNAGIYVCNPRVKKILSFGLSFFRALHGNAAAMIFCLGMSAMLAQIIMTRELMVAFYGNELAIGIIFAAWLLMVSAGSLVIRPFLSRLNENDVRTLIAALLAGLAIILPLLIFAARALRIFFGVPPGEYVPFGPMVAGAFLVLAPICLIIGIVFPGACRLPALGRKNVAGIYAAESAGSMIAGMAFSFIFVFLLPPTGLALLASICAVCGAALIAPRALARGICALAAIFMTALLIFPGPVKALENRGLRLRWESFGVLSRGGQQSGGKAKLIESCDSRYQNLALIEAEGQKTIYGNGQVMFVFPDEIFTEQKINFIMAQKPSARKVLLIGGNPVGDIPELLKYPLEKLVHVELDPLINRMLAKNAGADYQQAGRDPRLEQCLMDAPRFVKQVEVKKGKDGKKEKFDVVIAEGLAPTTIVLNRLYTVEFYRAISNLLAPDGFFYTAVESSELLQDEAATLAASIYKALQTVFPQVLVTAGPRNQFFAGQKNAPLTFDGNILYERWRSSPCAGVKTKYFRPEYFLNADEISAEKTDFVRRRISSLPAPANTALKPVSAFYNLFLWSRYSSSHLEPFLNWLKGLKFGWIAGGLGTICFLAILFMGAVFGKRTARGHEWPARLALVTVITATGFSGMALELILIFIFQTFLGYIYASIGLIIAMYMLGMTLGAWVVRKYSGGEESGRKKSWRLLLELDALLLFIALGLPVLMKGNWDFSATWPLAGAIYMLTLLTGWAGGVQFILANNLMEINSKVAGSMASHAALLNAADLAGAALGGISIGIIFLPLFGFAGTCYLLAILKTGSCSLIGVFLYFNTRHFDSRRCC